jgi:uncharacterized RDD family membrane protein YckC
MSENPRLQQWLEKVDEGKRMIPGSTPVPEQQPTIIRQEIVYTPQVPIYVGFWRRVFAVVLDSLILVVFLFFIKIHPIVEWLISFFYYTYCPSTHMQGTIGKLAIGAKIVGANGERISYLHSVGRYFAQFISGALLLIGYLMVAFHSKKRGLHDLMADTYVVNK